MSASLSAGMCFRAFCIESASVCVCVRATLVSTPRQSNRNRHTNNSSNSSSCCRFYPASSITFVILYVCFNLPTLVLKSPW